MKNIIILFLFISFYVNGQADYVDPVYIKTRITQSKQENERLKTQRNKTSIVVGGENVNKEKQTKYQKTTTAIKERLTQAQQTLSTLPSAVRIYTYSDKTKDNITKIIKLVQKYPTVLFSDGIFDKLADFTEEVNLALRLLSGVVLSYGNINKMEISDRMQMIRYVGDEFNFLYIESSTLYYSLRSLVNPANMLKGSTLSNYVNKDIEDFKTIIDKAKDIGNGF